MRHETTKAIRVWARLKGKDERGARREYRRVHRNDRTIMQTLASIDPDRVRDVRAAPAHRRVAADAKFPMRGRHRAWRGKGQTTIGGVPVEASTVAATLRAVQHRLSRSTLANADRRPPVEAIERPVI